jgi:glutamate-ammonia-ligase adenylyltransferase
VATSWQSFQVYQRDEAWVWEHLALTRARVIVGPPALTHDVEVFRRSLLGQDRKRAFILREVADMRQRIAAAKMSKGPLDAKIGPGRMLDVELISQAGALLAGVAARDVDAGLRGAVAIGWLGDADLTALKQVYDLCWQVQLASKLVYEQPLDPSALGQAGVRFLLRATGIDDVTKLQEQLDSLSTQAADRILKALQTPREDSP